MNYNLRLVVDNENDLVRCELCDECIQDYEAAALNNLHEVYAHLFCHEWNQE